MGRRVVSGGLLLILRLLLLLDVARLEAGGERVLGTLQGKRLVEFDLRLLKGHNAPGVKHTDHLFQPAARIGPFDVLCAGL